MIVLVAVVTLGLLIGLHEFGHFWVARRCGVKVLKFSIGFGPVITQWTDKQGTSYALSLIPLGGYVQMLGEGNNTSEEVDSPYAYANKAPWQRFLIVFAGPLMNFLLAVVALWVVLMMGTKSLVPIVGEVIDNSLAQQAGLQAGDRIIAIDQHKVQSARQLQMQLIQYLGVTGPLTIHFIDEIGQKQATTVQLSDWLKGAIQPDVLSGLGFRLQVPKLQPIIGLVVPDSAADQAKFKANDEIVAADRVKIDDWIIWQHYIKERPEQPIEVQVLREEVLVDLVLIPTLKHDKKGQDFGYAGLQ